MAATVHGLEGDDCEEAFAAGCAAL